MAVTVDDVSSAYVGVEMASLGGLVLLLIRSEGQFTKPTFPVWSLDMTNEASVTHATRFGV